MAPESGLIPLAQDYAWVSRDTNYLPIVIKRAKRDRAKRSACVGLDLQAHTILFVHKRRTSFVHKCLCKQKSYSHTIHIV